MQARGFITTLGAALVGASVGLASPVDAAPTGPDRSEQTSSDQQVQGGIVIVDRPSGIPFNRSRMFGVPPGLDYLRLPGDSIYLEVG